MSGILTSKAMGRLVQLAVWPLVVHFTMGSSVRSRLNCYANRVISGILVILAELLTLTVFRPWEEWIKASAHRRLKQTSLLLVR
jgi:hypothetical protein